MILYEKVDPSLFEKKEKEKWPFYKMAVGQCFLINNGDKKKAQKYVHIYAKSAKKKFRTMTDNDGNLLILRVS